MWLLVSIADKDVRYPILGDHQYVVGRQSCDIVLADSSVSRKQAVLTMTHAENNVQKSFMTPTLTLEDVSKFGTFVNGKPAKNPGGNTVTLKENDEIKFGGLPVSVFKAVYEPFVATTSCLERAPKKSLLKVMSLLGGHLVRDWRPICDLLIMSKINVTIKVICAINNQKHIVTPQYLDDLYSHLLAQRDRPDPTSYLPEVVDQEVPTGVSFHPDIRRSTLLQGMKFYFLSAVQFNKTNLAVSTAGGQPILLEDGTEKEAEAMTEDGTVVVAVSREVLATLSPSCQKFVKLVISVLKRKNLRMVTDPEIGWAVLTCNVVDFCNAKTSITPDMLAYMASQSMSQSTDAAETGPVVHSVQTPFIRPSLPDVHKVETSLIQDVKPEPNPDQVTPLVKTEANETLLKVKQDTSFVKPLGDLQTTSNKSLLPLMPGDISSSIQFSEERPQLVIENLNSQANRASGPETSSSVLVISSDKIVVEKAKTPAKGVSDSKSKHDASHDNFEFDEDEESPENVFARRQVKTNVGSVKLNNLDDDSDDELHRDREKSTSKRKRLNLFADDDDEEEEVQLSKQRKVYEESSSNVDKGSSSSSNINKESLKHNKALSSTIEQEPLKNGRASVINSSLETASKHEQSFARQDKVNGVLTSSKSKPPEQSCAGRDSLFSLCADSVSPPRLPQAGWFSTSMAASKVAKEEATGENGAEEDGLKPDTELLRDSEGKPLRNLCQIETVELIARPVAPPVTGPAKSRKPDQGLHNFKKFKKTQHVGAGKLPVIIGGRDLEVYLGTKHKDIEELFALGLVQENQRREEDQRDRDLFNWDDRTRKTSIKRAR